MRRGKEDKLDDLGDEVVLNLGQWGRRHNLATLVEFGMWLE